MIAPATISLSIDTRTLEGLAQEIGSKQYRAFVYFHERRAAIAMRDLLEHTMLSMSDDRTS